MNYLDSQLDLYVYYTFVSLLLLVQILILMWICIISTTKHSSSNKMKTKKQSESICPYLTPSQYPVRSPGYMRIYFVFVLIFMTCLLLKKICRSLIGWLALLLCSTTNPMLPTSNGILIVVRNWMLLFNNIFSIIQIIVIISISLLSFTRIVVIIFLVDPRSFLPILIRTHPLMIPNNVYKNSINLSCPMKTLFIFVSPLFSSYAVVSSFSLKELNTDLLPFYFPSNQYAPLPITIRM